MHVYNIIQYKYYILLYICYWYICIIFLVICIFLTLCCWGSFDLGCSFWRRWRDWTRRQAGSSRHHGAHTHNHCRTTKHIHTAPDQYQHVKKGPTVYCHTVSSTSLSYLSLYYWWPGACLAQKHIIIVYWLRPSLTNAPRQCETVCMEPHLRVWSVAGGGFTPNKARCLCVLLPTYMFFGSFLCKSKWNIVSMRDCLQNVFFFLK